MRTEDQKVKSSMELGNFVENYKLRDNNSLINFQATIKLKTPKNNIEISSSVRIFFEGYDEYGTLIINDEEDRLDTTLYPTEFKAKFNDFLVINSALNINGIHPNIGKYIIEIYPR